MKSFTNSKKNGSLLFAFLLIFLSGFLSERLVAGERAVFSFSIGENECELHPTSFNIEKNGVYFVAFLKLEEKLKAFPEIFEGIREYQNSNFGGPNYRIYFSKYAMKQFLSSSASQKIYGIWDWIGFHQMVVDVIEVGENSGSYYLEISDIQDPVYEWDD